MNLEKLAQLSMPALIFLITVMLGYILRRVLFNRFSRWASKTKTHLDDIIIGAVKAPFIIWCLMLGIYFAIQVSNLPQNYVIISGKILLVLGILSVTLVASNITTRIIQVYAQKFEGALPVTSLTQNISRIIIFGIGILVILNSLGLSITPILATLGVGGLAVALALQDTLANLFAGFHIIIAKQIKVGDYIKLDSGQEGYVSDINWRTTNIRMLPNNVVLIPNAKLIQTIITNFYLPDKEMSVTLDFSVHYKSDLDKVEQIALEVAKEVMTQAPGGVAGFSPVVRFGGFGESGINATAVLKCKEFVDQYTIKHEFVKRLNKRFQKEGIVIPYPVRAINYGQEGAPIPNKGV